MTLGNMRENGVRSLLVTCSNVTCRHEKIVNVDAYGDDLFVPSFGQGCGVVKMAVKTVYRVHMQKERKAIGIKWLGDLDSNQDSRSQSPMFYR
jgi:hypothetical protein